MLNINITFTTYLTRALIPKLSERPSLMLFLSSYTSAHPLAMMSVYSATKSYNEAFGQALAGELRPKNIDVRSILPYFVVSPMSGFRTSSWNVPDPISFAHTALAQVQCSDYTYSPHWAHDLLSRACDLLPDSMMGSMGLKNMAIARTRLIRRKERILAAKTKQKAEGANMNKSSANVTQ
uniref:Estradiol 17-beta-dehydrogenase 12-A n=1 Tax=Lygus hesperus TaxID=30085 RepID=A0A0A9XMY6_LYGHE